MRIPLFYRTFGRQLLRLCRRKSCNIDRIRYHLLRFKLHPQRYLYGAAVSSAGKFRPESKRKRTAFAVRLRRFFPADDRGGNGFASTASSAPRQYVLVSAHLHLFPLQAPAYSENKAFSLPAKDMRHRLRYPPCGNYFYKRNFKAAWQSSA